MKKSDQHKPTILIVDDLLISQRTIGMLFGPFEVNIRYASNGREAIDVCRELMSIDVILMDILMPVMNGTEAMNVIRRIPFYDVVPIVAMTGIVDHDTEGRKYLYQGFSDFCPKPVDIGVLLSIVQKYITLRSKKIREQ